MVGRSESVRSFNYSNDHIFSYKTGPIGEPRGRDTFSV